MIKITGFVIGAWMPYWFGWWGSVEYPIACTIAVIALWIIGALKTN